MQCKNGMNLELDYWQRCPPVKWSCLKSFKTSVSSRTEKCANQWSCQFLLLHLKLTSKMLPDIWNELERPYKVRNEIRCVLEKFEVSVSHSIVSDCYSIDCSPTRLCIHGISLSQESGQGFPCLLGDLPNKLLVSLHYWQILGHCNLREKNLAYWK